MDLENIRMIIKIGLIVITAQGILGQQCSGVKKEVTYARIPDSKSMLYLDEFETFIVGRQLNEMYFVLATPPAYKPDVNYKSLITKVPGSSHYTQTTKAETLAANPTCVTSRDTLRPVYGTDKAFFHRKNSTRQIQAMWSSCPDTYVMSMRCSSYNFGQRKCLTKDVNFGVYLHGDMDNAPMSEILEDLCRVTGVRFGSPSFEWVYSYGENTLC